MKGATALILAGGEGDRLSVLSEERAKPAVIFGGRYRIIDFTLSNCVNSGITNVGVLTQYRPRSLNDHIGIGRPWDLDRAGGGVTLLQPYLGRDASDWYSGTADAVYQNMYIVEESRAELILVLAGDHVYKMAYDELIAYHRAKGADLTIPVYGVPWEDASRFGTLFVDNERVTAFDEKPEKPRSNLISMGIYLFKKEVLLRALMNDAQRQGSHHDFGRDIVPALVADPSCNVFGSRFTGYWRDVGTIQSYYDANMDLLEDLPQFDLYERDFPIFTREPSYPPAKIGRKAEIRRSLLDLGCIINGSTEHSVLSPGVFVEEGAVVRDSIVFDDTYVSAGAVIDRSIIDKEVRIGRDSQIGYGEDWTVNKERPDIVNAGITIIGKRARLGARVRIGRNCVIGPGVTVGDGEFVPSGTTIRGEQRVHSLSV